MKTKAFFSQLDHNRMVAAIVDAEKHISGEIRVYVSHRKVRDVRHAAIHHFLKLGMHQTKHRNAVLIFVAPESQNFFVVGDEGVHAKCGDALWEQVASEMGELFKNGKFTDGIVHGIHTAGKLLAEHFPQHGSDHNELPDSVVKG
ncbi:MAG: TPM domain-containing protein [Verrucomicrobiia bacterium]